MFVFVSKSLLFKECFLRVFMYLFLEREGGREREGEGVRKGEKHQWVVVSHALSTGDVACNPGMCPDWELNW